jgi:hypothetical protein
MHLSTQPLTGEIKCPRLYLCFMHSIPSPPSNVYSTHAPTWSTMIWSTLYNHVIILVHQSWLHLLFIVVSFHQRQVLLKLHRHTWSLALKPPTCPSHLQPVHRARSCLDLLHLDHMTQCHVSCALSSFISTCVSFATTRSHLHCHGICCLHTCTYGLITYVSHINTISPPKVVTQLPKPNKDLSISPFLVVDDNSTKIWKLSSFQASSSHKCKLLNWFGFYATYPTFMLYDKIWINTIKPNLVVMTPLTYVLKWLGFKLAHMHKYEICGSVTTTKWC